MKMTLKNRTALVALLFGLALSLVPKVNASGPFATNYTNASLTGVYGYSSDGWHLGSSNPSKNTTNIPLDAAGVMWFDGLGTFKFHDTADLGGFVIQRGTADNPIRSRCRPRRRKETIRKLLRAISCTLDTSRHGDSSVR